MEEQDVMYWSDFVDFTHAKQVEMFGWCACEDNEGRENPYEDCLTEGRENPYEDCLTEGWTL